MQEINTVWILQRQAAHVPKFFTQILLRSGREFTMVKLALNYLRKQNQTACYKLVSWC